MVQADFVSAFNEPPFIRARGAAELNGIVRGNVLRPLGLTTGLQISGRGDRDPPHLADMARHQRRIRQMTDPDREQLKREYERMTVTVRYGPVVAFGKAAQKVYDLSVFSVKMLGQNGKTTNENPLLATPCGQRERKTHKKAGAHR